MTEQEYRKVLIAKMFDPEVAGLLSEFSANMSNSEFTEFYRNLFDEQATIEGMVQVAKAKNKGAITTVEKATEATTEAPSPVDLTMNILKAKYNK